MILSQKKNRYKKFPGGEISMRRKFLAAKFPSGEKFRAVKVPCGENSPRQKFHAAKIPRGEKSHGENSLGEKFNGEISRGENSAHLFYYVYQRAGVIIINCAGVIICPLDARVDARHPTSL